MCNTKACSILKTKHVWHAVGVLIGDRYIYVSCFTNHAKSGAISVIGAIACRYVRIGAGSFMGALAPLAGRNLGKALKSLAGPWWLAQSDPDPECARVFKAAFTQVFPGAKQREALVFCSSQVASTSFL